jgi:site-specific DNA-methyltransferase (adenine-specific)/adenine-specific DNA-methyltransferase
MKDFGQNDVNFLIECLKAGKEIPTEYKYALFPTKQKEYELVYAGKARKEDILADNEEAKAVPLQVEKIFNGNKYPLAAKGWHNFLVFGDNLQILKTFYRDEDPLIKGKVKGKVKLIYIDPPFATESDFGAKKGQKAYSDKTRGAEFVEFLRKRLIIAKELLAEDGCIYVHLDGKKGHYAKIVLDEVFGEGNFMNELIWLYSGREMTYTYWNAKHQNIFLYAKNRESMYFDWEAVGEKPSPEVLKQYKHIDEEGKRYVIRNDKGSKGLSVEGPDTYRQYYKSVPPRDWFEIPIVSSGDENIDYPTQKPEKLLQKLISASSKKGDLVMDFFCGSGTTLAVAEKLGRRWIGCDIGKLAIYTTQKRLLEIENTKDLLSAKKLYGKVSKSFGTVTSGLYDLGKVFSLQKDDYIEFVKQLFEIEETKNKSIGGVSLDGKHRDFYVKIFPYWELGNASVDEKYLIELHKNLGAKTNGRLYIVAPANNVHFISDYHEIDGVRFYFLKVPYQIIKELHKVQFKKLRQPQSKKQVNDLDEAIGFHFIRQPEVKSELKSVKDKVNLKIKKFESAYTQDEAGEKLSNFESLAMVLVDLNYNDDQFLMSEYFFAQDLIKNKKQNQKSESEKDEEQSEEEIRKELEKRKEIVLDFDRVKCGNKLMVVYVDIYGNEFREMFQVK